MIVVGHRGWPQKYPENTLASFRAALSLGVDAVELDVHLTRDGRLVVMHDQDAERTTGVPGSVRGMTLDEVKRLDAGRWFGPEFAGERVPTLEEVMELVQGKAALTIEVKSPGGAGAQVNDALLGLLKSYTGAAVVQSFDADYLREFRKVSPETDTGLLCTASPLTVALATDIGCTAIHPAWQTVTHDLNLAIRVANLRIMVWSVRTEDDCRTILSTLDTDAIGTDCPDVLIRILEERDER